MQNNNCTRKTINTHNLQIFIIPVSIPDIISMFLDKTGKGSYLSSKSNLQEIVLETIT